MRAQGTRIHGLLLVAMLLPGAAAAAEIQAVQVQTGPTGTRAEIQLDAPGAYRLLHLQAPERLAVDFSASRLARGLRLPAAAGSVRGVRSGQPEPGTVRIVFDLAASARPLPPRLEQSAGGARLVIEWPGDGPAPAALEPATATAPAAPRAPDPIAALAAGLPAASASAPEPAPRPAPERAAGEVAVTAAGTPAPAAVSGPAPAASARTATAAEAGDGASPSAPTAPLPAGTRPLVIAIDAGHGGQDPGARGPNGTREKDVTLAIARELARQVNATPGMRAFLTREDDYFIPLEQRARKASAHKADIFISIHADAAENRGARGSSVYILSTRGASSQRARWLADKENAADVIGGGRVRVADSTLTSVLLDLTQSGNMKASEDAAGHVLGGLRRVGNVHKHEIERANFAVLRTSDKMPAMLVETAFISNPEEEKRLADPAFQRLLAGAILDGVDRYFSRQPPPGTLYALRARAREQGGYASAAGGSP